MKIHHYFHEGTSTLTYLVYDEVSRDSLVIDPVLDYSPEDQSVALRSVERVSQDILEKNLNLRMILETHVHADHLTGAQGLKKNFPQAQVGASVRITEVQKTFSEILGVKNVRPEGKDFDFLFQDNVTLKIGSLELKVFPTPGHTPACSSFLIQDALFTGDALFMPDYGTARCDFPGGSARDLFQSIKGLYTLPDNTRVFVGHDYQPGGRELRFETSIGQSKKKNIHLKENTSEEEFVSFRNQRDMTLKEPRLLKPSLRANIVAGRVSEIHWP